MMRSYFSTISDLLYQKSSTGHLLLAILFVVLAIPFTSYGSETPGKDLNTFSIYLENDSFAAAGDGEYSNGLKLTWSSAIQDEYPNDVWPHRWLYPLIKRLPFEKYPDRKRNITFAFGQNIYTPEDIESKEVVKDERPYAGISYLSLGFHSRQNRHMDTFEVTLGLVGPNSYAAECQKIVHRVFDYVKPEGWDNQLNNEPILELLYEHKKKLIPSHGRGFGNDLILNTGGGFGNAMIYYNLGLSYRIGWNLPNDFGIFSIRPVSSFNGSLHDESSESFKKEFGVQLFLSTEGRAVLHNIFLDGNTFTDSHSVDKEPVVGDLMFGLNFCFDHAQISMAYVFRTKEYVSQKKAQRFGGINISVSY